jgi:hypothetical protein
VSEKKSMGLVLRSLGSSPCEVVCYQQDFSLQQIPHPQSPGEMMPYPCQSLFGFQATAFREVEKDSDLWEFTTVQEATTAEGVTQRVRMLVHLRGADIFTVRVASMLA